VATEDFEGVAFSTDTLDQALLEEQWSEVYSSSDALRVKRAPVKALRNTGIYHTVLLVDEGIFQTMSTAL
jgi:hypothetical protein